MITDGFVNNCCIRSCNQLANKDPVNYLGGFIESNSSFTDALAIAASTGEKLPVITR